MLRGLSPRRRLLVVAVALVTVAGGLAVVALRLAGGPDGGGAGTATTVTPVVLLGSPNHGTELAALAGTVDASLCVDTCADLATGSRFLARLNAGDETPPGPDYTSVWTQRDQVVTPPASARLRGAVNVRVQDVCADASFGHSGLVRDPLALGLVVRTVDGGLPATPRPADCLPLRALGALAPP